ncbi:MAG TPA: class I SAM-dependent methyltransferase [Acetobacteraceae bacterium]|nr:class I SAM-dependent methyltransferase [Acetobacteraceae bacterium]
MAGVTPGAERFDAVPARPGRLAFLGLRAAATPLSPRRGAGGAGFPLLAAAVAARYAPCGRAARGYVAGKLRYDPVHRAVLTLAGGAAFGAVVDLGCGRGQLGVALLLAGRASSVLGIDLPGMRLGQAARAGGALGLSTMACDLAGISAAPAADTVLLIDVLYQLPTASQLALLAAAAQAARALVLVRTLDPARGLRSRLTVGLEHAWRRVSAHAGAMVNPRPLAELTGVLEAAGFAVTVAPCWQGTPFANVLLTARRTHAPLL